MELKRATGMTDSATRQHCAALYQQQATTYRVTGIATEILAYSRGYLQFITTKARLDHRMRQLYTDPFIYILKEYAGLLRDRAVAAYCIDNIRIMKQPGDLIQQALAVMKEPGSRSVLEGIQNDSGKGAAAYNFSLLDSSGRVVQLSDFKGKVVFIDFWYTGCGACSKFYKNALSVVEKTFEHNSDVVFLTVSIDQSREVWQRSVHNGFYTSGNESNVINLYTNGESIGHPLIVHYKIAGYPFQLLIDKKGRIYKSSELQRPPGELIPIIKEALAIQ
jgi:cytochrome oxidase Cu insertion factor (SCO1/SenC/PrrC family)